MKEGPKRCGKGGTKRRGGRRRGKEVGKEEEIQRVLGEGRERGNRERGGKGRWRESRSVGGRRESKGQGEKEEVDRKRGMEGRYRLKERKKEGETPIK